MAVKDKDKEDKDDVKIEAPEGEEKPAKKKGKLGKLPMLIALVVVVGGFLAADYFALHMVFKKGKPKTAATGKKGKKGKPGKPKKMGKIHKMEPFIVNLADPGGRRYFKVQVVLEFDKAALQDELKQRRAQLRSNIILLLTSKTYTQVATMAGKIKLRNQIIRAINKVLTKGKVYSLYFTDFVIQ